MRPHLVPNVVQGAAKMRIDKTVWCRDCSNTGWVWLVELRGEPCSEAAPCPCCEVGQRHNNFNLVYQQTGYNKPYEYVPVEIPVRDRFWSFYTVAEARWQGPNSGTGKLRRAPGAQLVAS